MNCLRAVICMTFSLALGCTAAAGAEPERIAAKPAASGKLAEQLRTGSSAERQAALSQLADREPDPDLLPALFQALVDGDYRVRLAAHEELLRIGDAAVPGLIAQLQRDEDRPRQIALHLLREAGPAAEPALPVCVQLLDHKDFHTRYLACRVLGAVGSPGLPARDRLIQALKEDVTSVRRNAAAALGDIGPEIGKPGLDALIQALADFSQPVRQQAVIALGKLGDLAEPAVPAIEARLKNPAARRLDSKRFRPMANAAKTLWILNPDSPLVLECLLCDLRENDDTDAATRVLGEIGPQLKAVAPLERMLRDPDPLQRHNAALALAAIGPAARTAIPALESLREDPDPHVRDAVSAALRAVAAPSPPGDDSPAAADDSPSS